MEINYKYNSKSWEFDVTSKRIIAWLSNYNLTFNESDKSYQKKYNLSVKENDNFFIKRAID